MPVVAQKTVYNARPPSRTFPTYELISEFLCCYSFGIMLTEFSAESAHILQNIKCVNFVELQV